MVEAATAFFEGACKYGRYNWRRAGVRSSIYAAALLRHTFKWWNGEDADPVTRVKHLANAAACIGILLDAELQGQLTDDRPPAQPRLSARIDELSEVIAHLKKLFESHNPYQYTIADNVDCPATKRPEWRPPMSCDDNPWGVNPLTGPGSASPIKEEIAARDAAEALRIRRSFGIDDPDSGDIGRVFPIETGD
jgi:hypothetical protein